MTNVIQLTWEQVFPKSAYLAGVRPYYEYVDGKRTGKQIGWTYSLVNRAGYDKVNVKVVENVPILTQEEIEKSESDILVIAEGFVGSIYNSDGRIAISGKAEKVVLI
jgi:hypothetical protein